MRIQKNKGIPIEKHNVHETPPPPPRQMFRVKLNCSSGREGLPGGKRQKKKKCLVR